MIQLNNNIIIRKKKKYKKVHEKEKLVTIANSDEIKTTLCKKPMYNL